MAEMKFICMYKDYVDVFRDLTDVRRGRLIMAVLEYAFGGGEPQLRGEERLAFSMIRSQIDRDREKYIDTCQRNREHGKKGGRPKKALALEENPAVFEKPKEKENIKENEKENIKENENVNVNENESSGWDTGGWEEAQRQLPPVLDPDTIKNYCYENGLVHVDPQKFYDYYAANGWRMGRGPMVDWRAAIRNWDRQDAAKVLKEESDAYSDEHYSRFLEEYVYKDSSPLGWNSAV